MTTRESARGAVTAFAQLAPAAAFLPPGVDTRTWLERVQPLFAWAADTGEPKGPATPGPSGMRTGVIQARSPLPYLSEDDNHRIFAGVERRRVAPGEDVIRPDERRQALARRAAA